jgi:hypothetical protein
VRIGDNLNCRLSSFPITYLGIPIRDTYPIKDLGPLVGRGRMKAEPWRGSSQLRAARLYSILIDSCLSSPPMYIIGLYLLSEGVHDTFDKELLCFFWMDTNGRQ